MRPDPRPDEDGSNEQKQTELDTVGPLARSVGDIAALLGEEPVTLDVETEGYYAGWKRGTMDFVIEPLPLDDGVHIVSRILPLWEIPTREQAEAYDTPHAQLAWTGAAPVCRVPGGGAALPMRRLEPGAWRVSADSVAGVPMIVRTITRDG